MDEIEIADIFKKCCHSCKKMEIMIMRESQGESVCVCERESEGESACERERVRKNVFIFLLSNRRSKQTMINFRIFLLR